MLRFLSDATLDQLDAALRMFISFCARYHGGYTALCGRAGILKRIYSHRTLPAESPSARPRLRHSPQLGTLYVPLRAHVRPPPARRTDRTSATRAHAPPDPHRPPADVLCTPQNTDPHCQLIIYNVLLAWGRRHAKFLRSHKRWSPIVPLLIDHVRLDLDLDAGDAYLGVSTMGGPARGLSVPIETKLRLLSVQLLYQVCRVQTLSLKDLGTCSVSLYIDVANPFFFAEIFDDTFIEFLFELVEQTRDQHDETFNYAVIKLIVRCLFSPQSLGFTHIKDV